MTANSTNLTSIQKEFMECIRLGHAELVESNYKYPVLTCSIDTFRTARSLERRGLITIGTIGNFEFNVQLVTVSPPVNATATNKPTAKTDAEKNLLEQVAQFFENKKKQLKKITTVDPKTTFLDEVISELRSMQ